MDDVARSTTYPYPSADLDLTFEAGRSSAPRKTRPSAEPEIPYYLQETYYWAYVNPRNVRWLDREIVVRTILWQQHRKLQKLAFSEVLAGQRVLQPASVYGSFAPNLATHIGPNGHLDVVDVAPAQIHGLKRKLAAFDWASVHHSNILDFEARSYDVVCCYFLLHEVPDDYKYRIANLLLGKVNPGGKVVFIDYHKPRWWHPLKLITSIVFDTLEPYAKRLWRSDIRDFAEQPDRFSWRKETIFGALFQKVVATRLF